MIPFLFPFSRGLLFPLVALDKIINNAYTAWGMYSNANTTELLGYLFEYHNRNEEVAPIFFV